MTSLSKYRVLISGILSPFAAVILYVLVYSVLTRFSTDLEKDWLFRLSLSTFVIAVPFLITLMFAVKDRSRNALQTSGKVGLAIAIFSLGLAWKPVSDGIARSKQSRNMAMRDVPAPPFEAMDLSGKTERLADHQGQVVLVNIWATWCVPCREEMPKLDRLYRDRQ